ncbi:glycosyltransferase [Enterococcus sp. AZ109]|uniref:glycosyltransferase n=1 Tax=Enterococcus sp. AZ109 TaxID=2774634 RepID=UPI003F68783B
MVATIIGKELDKFYNVFFIPYQDDKNYMNIDNEKLVPIFKSRSIMTKNIIKLRKGVELVAKKGGFTPKKYMKEEITSLKKTIIEKKLDVLILNSAITTVFFCEEIKKDFPNLRIISWMHEDTDYSFNEITKNYKKAFLCSLKATDLIVCLSKKALNVYSDINENTLIIHNPMILKESGIADLSRKVISFTARLDIYVKGIDYLLDVANTLPDEWKIRIAGQGTESEEKAFFELVESKGASNKIEYVGPLKGRSLAKHYQESSIFISTSRTEALPLVMIEAMTFGLPIVSFDHSGAQELLKDDSSGMLIPNFDTVKMTQQLDKLIKNEDLRIEFQKKVLKRAKLFKLDGIVSEWKEVLDGKKCSNC